MEIETQKFPFKYICFSFEFHYNIHVFFPGSPVTLNHDGEGEDRDKLVKLLEEYKKYKQNFTKNLLFDSSLGNLSRSNDVNEFAVLFLIYSWDDRVCPPEVSPDLLRHGHLRQDRE